MSILWLASFKKERVNNDLLVFSASKWLPWTEWWLTDAGLSCSKLISMQRTQCWNYWESADDEDNRGIVGALKIFCKLKASQYNFKMIDSLNSHFEHSSLWFLGLEQQYDVFRTARDLIEKSRINWLSSNDC